MRVFVNCNNLFKHREKKERVTNGYQICIVLAEWIARFSLCHNYVSVCICVCGYCCNIWIAKSVLFPFNSVCKYIRLDMNRLDCHHSQNGFSTRKSWQQQQHQHQKNCDIEAANLDPLWLLSQSLAIAKC